MYDNVLTFYAVVDIPHVAGILRYHLCSQSLINSALHTYTYDQLLEIKLLISSCGLFLGEGGGW